MAVKSTTKSTSAKTATPAKAAKNKPVRKIDKPQYKSFRLSKRIRHDAKALPRARKLFAASVRHIFRHKRLFFGILLTQLLLSLIFVKGFGIFTGNFAETKDIVQELFAGDSSLLTGVYSSLTLVGVLVTSTNSGSTDVANLYASVLLLIGSLVIVWALRQTHGKARPKFKEAYYNGLYPLVPFLLVMCVVMLQLLPLVLGNALYSIVVSNGIAVTMLEKILWLLVFMFSGLLSLYMISSSVFALYIVTLPNITPMQALRSARQLVLHRRAMVARKVLFLPLGLLLLLVAIMLPIIIYATVIAEAVFFVLTVAALILAHAYMYELYRKLL